MKTKIKKSCKYVDVCGSEYNCQSCNGYEPKGLIHIPAILILGLCFLASCAPESSKIGLNSQQIEKRTLCLYEIENLDFWCHSMRYDPCGVSAIGCIDYNGRYFNKICPKFFRDYKECYEY